MCVLMYVYVYICARVRMHVCIGKHICACMYVYVDVNVCMYVFLSVSLSICLYYFLISVYINKEKQTENNKHFFIHSFIFYSLLFFIFSFMRFHFPFHMTSLTLPFFPSLLLPQSWKRWTSAWPRRWPPRFLSPRPAWTSPNHLPEPTRSVSRLALPCARTERVKSGMKLVFVCFFCFCF